MHRAKRVQPTQPAVIIPQVTDQETDTPGRRASLPGNSSRNLFCSRGSKEQPSSPRSVLKIRIRARSPITTRNRSDSDCGASPDEEEPVFPPCEEEYKTLPFPSSLNLKALRLPKLEPKKRQPAVPRLPERRGERSSAHTRVSSMDSQDPIAWDLNVKTQDWLDEDGPQCSDANGSDRAKLCSASAQSRTSGRGAEVAPPRLLSAKDGIGQSSNSSGQGTEPTEKPLGRFGAGEMELMMKARDHLLASTQRQEGTKEKKKLFINLATSTPADYPMLNLKGKDLGDEDMGQVVMLLDIYPFAKELDLSNNRISLNLEGNLTFRHGHQSITRLSLSRNNLGSIQTNNILGRFVLSFAQLKTLELNDCALTDSDLYRLTMDLCTMQTLRKIELSGNGITDEGALVLGRMLEKCEKLMYVDLTRTKVSSKVWRLLRKHRSKLVLDVRRTCCGDCILQ